jgi:hypothetical protein
MIPHRTKIRELIIRAWRDHFQVLRRELVVRLPYFILYCISFFLFSSQAAVGRISFTMDIWSDQNRDSYLAMTAHWIARHNGTDALQFKTALVAFHRLHGRHDGKTIARTVLHLLDRAGITVKVNALLLCPVMTVT